MQRRGSTNGAAASSRIRVAVRVRPPEFKIPKDETRPPCVAPSPHAYAANVLEFRHDTQTKTFTFDHVFGSSATQEDVYAGSLQPLMAQFLDGYNVTVMAYGQTGSGKTYTMGNKVSMINTTPTTSPSRERSSSIPAPTIIVSDTRGSQGSPTTSPCRERSSSIPAPTMMTPDARGYQGSNDDGLMPRFLSDLFVNLKKEPSVREIRVTFVEIYLDNIRDLLDERPNKVLTIREDDHNVWVENVRSVQVDSLGKAIEVLNTGRARQTVGVNALNDESSRSHAVYTMEVSRKFQSEIKKSKVAFVDLAGSERITKTLVEGMRQRESIQINMGLSALGNVINALADERRTRRNSQDVSPSRPSSPGTFIPYRTAKLTRLLRDGLGGNARTLIIACVSPLDSNASETMSTLQFANRARNIQNKAEKNVSQDVIVIQPNSNELEIARLQEDVKRLLQQISELEATTKKRDEEVSLAEQARQLRKQKKLEDRRDAEMTTEIIIYPHMDAQTQHEDESPNSQQSTFSDAITMTESLEEVPVSIPSDASVQVGASLSESAEVESMTDQDAVVATNEASTVCDLQSHSVIDREIQFGASYLHFHEVGSLTDPGLRVESHDFCTETCIESVDVTCQCVTSVTQVVEVGVVTDQTHIIETMDACSECATAPCADADCQPDFVSTADVTTQITSDLAFSYLTDASTQNEYISLVDAATSSLTIQTSDVATECLEMTTRMDVCRSVEAAATKTVEASCQTADASVACLVVSKDDEACQSDIPILQTEEQGIMTDSAPVKTASTSTDFVKCDAVEVACQYEPASCVDGTDNLASAAIDAMTTDPMVNQTGTDGESTHAFITSNDSKSGPLVGATNPRAFEEADLSKSRNDQVRALVVDTYKSDEGEFVDCLSPTSSTSSLSDTCCSRSVRVAPISVTELPDNDKADLSNEATTFNEVCTMNTKCVDDPTTDLTQSTSPPGAGFLAESLGTDADQQVYLAAQAEHLDQRVLQLFGLGSSAKFSRSLTPEAEANEDESLKSPNSSSENQIDVEDSDEELAVSSRGVDDDSFDEERAFTTRCSLGTEIIEAKNETQDLNDLATPGPVLSPSLPPTLVISVKPSAISNDLTTDEGELFEDCQPITPLAPTADFVVVRSPRHGASSHDSNPQRFFSRGMVQKRSQFASRRPVRPLRMFTFDDEIATSTTTKTAVQAKHLYESLRQLARDEFGSDGTDMVDHERTDVDTSVGISTVGKLMLETKEFIKRREKRHHRIVQLRYEVSGLEELLCVDNRAPIGEAELGVYSERVQEEFLSNLRHQLITLAADRLHRRLEARVEAEQMMPLPTADDQDSTSPFLSLDKCQACAEWFFRRTEDVAFFEKQVFPLITSGWITLTSPELDAEQAWFQL